MYIYVRGFAFLSFKNYTMYPCSFKHKHTNMYPHIIHSMYTDVHTHSHTHIQNTALHRITLMIYKAFPIYTDHGSTTFTTDKGDYIIIIVCGVNNEQIIMTLNGEESWLMLHTKHAINIISKGTMQFMLF